MNEIEKIFAYSHQNISCTHGTTIEITKDSDLTVRGTCVLGLKASKASADLNENLRTLLLKGKMIEVVISLDDLVDRFYGYGNKNLSLLNEKDIV